MSIWVDEAVYVRYATYPLHMLLAELHAHGENHPPLYFLLLHGMAALSQGEAWVRLPSVAFGVLAVALTFALARDTCGDDRVAFLAAGFLAISDFHVVYSQEARMYAMATALGLASNRFFWRILRGRGGGLGYVASTAACAYTHYFTGFCWMAQIATLLAVRPGGRVWRRWLGAQAAVAVLYLPWMWGYMRHMQVMDRSTQIVPHAVDGLLLALSYAYGNDWTLPAVGSRLALAALFALPPAWLAGRGLRALDRPAAWLLAANVLIPTGVTFALARTTSFHVFLVHYFSLFQPYAVIVAARGLVDARRAVAAAAAVLMVGMNLWSLSHHYFDPTFANQDWREVAALMTREAKPGEVVVVQPSMFVLPLRYYYRGAAPLFPVDDGAGRVLPQRIAGASGAWLCDVPYHPVVLRDPARHVLDASLDRVGEMRTGSTWADNVIEVIRYRRRGARGR